MNIRRVTAFLLSCLLMVGMVSGCSKKEDDGTIITYIPTYYPLDESIQDVGTACSGNGLMYFIGYIPGGKESYMDAFGEMVEYETNQQALFRINLDGSGMEQLTEYQRMEIPEDRMGNAYIENMMVGPDGALWVVENINTYYYDCPKTLTPIPETPGSITKKTRTSHRYAN